MTRAAEQEFDTHGRVSPMNELPRWCLPRTAESRPSIVLGTMNFGKRTPEDEARRIVDRAIERGVRLFDTANVYCDGESERILGRALSGAGNVAVATKVGLGRRSGKPEGLGAASVERAVDESLGRLGRDSIDLYYMHAPDRATPVEETLGAFDDLVRSGKVQHVGISNYASWEALEMLHVAERRAFAPPRVAQQLYNVLIRQLDVEYFRFARRFGLHTTVYNPLAGGLLSGRYRPGDAVPQGSRFDGNRMYVGRYYSPRMMALMGEYQKLAAELDLELHELAYAWLAQCPGVDSILVGPGTVAHLDAALDAIDEVLPPEAIARIESIHTAYLGTETTYAR